MALQPVSGWGRDDSPAWGCAMTFSGDFPEPYVGLRAFRRADAVRFFGRERDAAELVRLWHANRLTVLHGPPGVGKSSLVAAGLLPRLNPYQTDVLPVGGVVRSWPLPAALIPDDSDPLVVALLSSWSSRRSLAEISELSVLSYLQRRNTRHRPVMAVIDQAEDIFTAAAAPRHPTILDQLSAALDSKLPLHLLVVIRDDQADAFQRHEGLRAHMAKGASYALKPLDVDAAVQACVEPMELIGRSFAPGAAEKLVDRLADDRASRDSPPTIEPVHVQVACSALWEAVQARVHPVAMADLPDVDRILARFCFTAIDQVADEYLDGDRDALTAALQRVAGEERVDETTLTEPVAQALVRRHILRPGEKRRYEMPDRLIGPFHADVPAERVPAEAAEGDHLRRGEYALHTGSPDVARRCARHVLDDPAASARSRARATAILADVAFTSGAWHEAAPLYQRAAQILATLRGTDPIVATMLAAAGRAFLRQGALAAAVTELYSAVRRSWDPAIKAEFAWALHRADETMGDHPLPLRRSSRG